MTDRDIPVMLSVRECAKRTGVSYQCLLQLCKDGRIAFIKTGNKYLINVQRLTDYLNNAGENSGRMYEA